MTCVSAVLSASDSTTTTMSAAPPWKRVSMAPMVVDPELALGWNAGLGTHRRPVPDAGL